MLPALAYFFLCTIDFSYDVIAGALRFAELRGKTFDWSRPAVYNVASFVLLAAPIAAISGALMAWRYYTMRYCDYAFVLQQRQQERQYSYSVADDESARLISQRRQPIQTYGATNDASERAPSSDSGLFHPVLPTGQRLIGAPLRVGSLSRGRL